MRVLMLSRSTPYLPTHERARRAPAHLLEQLSGRHAFALVAPAARAETPAQRAWAAAACSDSRSRRPGRGGHRSRAPPATASVRCGPRRSHGP